MDAMGALVFALIGLSIVLITVVLRHPLGTVGPIGKALVFMALFVLPALCLMAGASTHMARSEQTRFCISCHSMERYGQSLYIDDAHYIPAAHFQNHRVPADQACYACHSDYTIFGPLKDKLAGVTRIYMQYVSTPPNPITIKGGFNNLQCLRCHAGARGFMENPTHTAMMDSLKTNQLSCISCHDMVHAVDQVDKLKKWSPVP